jgi:hypothetical protein
MAADGRCALQPIPTQFQDGCRGGSGMKDSRAQSYREQAKRLREKAVNLKSSEMRQAMEETAAQYERLAEALEAAAKRSFR